MDKAERDRLIAAYGEGPSLLKAAWESVPEDARMWRPALADWSAHEIVIHCADSETYAATRIRLLAAEADPVIVGYDQDAWVGAFTYDNLPADVALTVIEAVRALTLRVIEALGEDDVGTRRNAYRIRALHCRGLAAHLRRPPARPCRPDSGECRAMECKLLIARNNPMTMERDHTACER